MIIYEELWYCFNIFKQSIIFALISLLLSDRPVCSSKPIFRFFPNQFGVAVLGIWNRFIRTLVFVNSRLFP